METRKHKVMVETVYESMNTKITLGSDLVKMSPYYNMKSAPDAVNDNETSIPHLEYDCEHEC